MASYQNRVGPWSIKRSRSVPDASAPLFAPDHESSRVTRLLAKVNEERARLGPSFLGPPRQHFNEINWFNDPRYQRSVDVEKDAGMMKSCRKSRSTVLENESAILKSIILIGPFIFAVVPLQIASFLQDAKTAQLTLSVKAPTAMFIYVLICILAIMIGLVSAIAWNGMKAPSITEHGPRLKLKTTIGIGLATGISLSFWWIAFVLPPIVIAKAGVRAR